MRLAVQRALTGAGYVVHTASDGETGIVAARETLPDLVLLDLVLPKASGLDVLRALKQDAITKNIPVVVLATLSQPNREEMLTILLVDDSVHLQITFKKVLTSSGYRVELAGDGEEGLRLALSTRPDVILLDMMLPKLGGVEVLLALKANRATAKIPVIALSGLPMSNEARLRRDGAISYLQKSNLEDLDVLLQAIDYALLLTRGDEFSPTAFLPNLPLQS
jgi:CheY-like chemotaxis protein